MTKSGLRPLSIGEILDGAFTLYREHFGLLVLTTALCGLPALVADFALPELVSAIVGLLGGLVTYAALTWMAAEIVLGRRPDMGTAIGFGVRSAPRIVASTMCVGLVMVLAMGGAGLVGAGIGLLGGGSESGRVVTAVAGGFVALCLLSYLFVRYFAVYQVVVLERERHFLKRSALLARGAFWKISTVWTVGALVVSLPWMLVLFGAGFGVGMSGGLEGGELDPETTQAALVLVALIPIVTWLMSALTSPFTSALGVLLYLDQRVRKDGLDVELAVTGLEVHPAGRGKSLAA